MSVVALKKLRKIHDALFLQMLIIHLYTKSIIRWFNDQLTYQLMARSESTHFNFHKYYFIYSWVTRSHTSENSTTVMGGLGGHAKSELKPPTTISLNAEPMPFHYRISILWSVGDWRWSLDAVQQFACLDKKWKDLMWFLLHVLTDW